MLTTSRATGIFPCSRVKGNDFHHGLLGVEQLKARAAELGLNADQFSACLDQGKFASQVQADLDAGTKAGVNGTPAMFINGRFISGAQPIEEITKVIDDELKKRGVVRAGQDRV